MLRVLGIPLLENRTVTKFPFHVFDRYEIHIKDVEIVFWAIHHFPLQISKVQKFKQNHFMNFKERKLATFQTLKMVNAKNGNVETSTLTISKSFTSKY